MPATFVPLRTRQPDKRAKPPKHEDAPHKPIGVSQGKTQRTSKPVVAGSSPAGGATFRLARSGAAPSGKVEGAKLSDDRRHPFLDTPFGEMGLVVLVDGQAN